MNDKYYTVNYISNLNLEILDPSREACIIYIDSNGNEEYREYFGNNSRIEINKK